MLDMVGCVTWWATVMGSQRIRHDLVIKHFGYNYSIWES